MIPTYEDVFFCLPVAVALLLFLATLGGWGLKRGPRE